MDDALIVARLRAAGCVFAEEEAALLVAEAPDTVALNRMIGERVSGLPLEHILGWAEFCSLRIIVDTGVFVPRQRTAFLVDIATRLATAAPVVVDLCCGSGAIAAAIGARLPDADLFACDIDGVAVRTARLNLPPHRVFEGDLFDPLPAHLRGRVGIIVANTPYVPTGRLATMPPEARLHEARVALDGGQDGLELQRRVAAEASAWLALGGHLLVETSEDQAESAVTIFLDEGLTAWSEYSLELEATVVIGRR